MRYEFVDEAERHASRIRKSITMLDSEITNSTRIADLIFIQNIKDMNRESYVHLDKIDEIINEVKTFINGLGDTNEQK